MLQDKLRVFLFPVFAYFTRNEGCIFSTFEHFDLNVTSGNKIFHLVTEGNFSTRRSWLTNGMAGRAELDRERGFGAKCKSLSKSTIRF